MARRTSGRSSRSWRRFLRTSSMPGPKATRVSRASCRVIVLPRRLDDEGHVLPPEVDGRAVEGVVEDLRRRVPQEPAEFADDGRRRFHQAQGLGRLHPGDLRGVLLPDEVADLLLHEVLVDGQGHDLPHDRIEVLVGDDVLDPLEGGLAVDADEGVHGPRLELLALEADGLHELRRQLLLLDEPVEVHDVEGRAPLPALDGVDDAPRQVDVDVRGDDLVRRPAISRARSALTFSRYSRG